MAKLKVSASTLPELIIAALIICICFMGFSQSMLHFFAPEYNSKSEQIREVLEELEHEFRNDENFPRSLNNYKSNQIEIYVNCIGNSDSLYTVQLIYSEEHMTDLNVKNFIYAQD